MLRYLLCLLPAALHAQNCTISAGADTFICAGNNVQLQAAGMPAPIWSPAAGLSCTACPAPLASPAVTTTYTVTATQTVNATVNGDFSQGVTGFTSGYILDNVSLWNEGTYTVNTNPNNVHPNWTNYGDHTTGTGNYLIVNGSSTPGVSVWCQTVAIPPNTNFNFSCWGLNLSNPPPTLQFSINGVPQSTFTMPQTVGVWTQYATVWNSGANNTVTICIENMNTMVGGNDFGLDDIDFSYTCSDTDSVSVTVYPLPVADFSVTQNVDCDSVCPVFTNFSAVAPPQQITSWQWNMGDNTTQAQQQPQHCYTVPGSYDISLAVTTDKGCTHAVMLNDTVTVYAPPVAAFTPDHTETSILDPQFIFTDNSLNAITWNWNFGDPLNSTSAMQSPAFTYPGIGTYTVCLMVTGLMGCADTACTEVEIKDEWTIYVPNCFTPNSNGSNDMFQAKGENVVAFNMQLFNRWGELIFETDDMNVGWNGVPANKTAVAPEGVYVYKITATGNDGKQRRLIGHVVLLR